MSGNESPGSEDASFGVNLIFPSSVPKGAAAKDIGQFVEKIVEALYADPTVSAAIQHVAGSETAGRPRYVRWSDLHGRAPPAGVPTFNEEILVLSVPVSTPNGADIVKAAIRKVPGGDEVGVEAAVPYSVPKNAETSGREP